MRNDPRNLRKPTRQTNQDLWLQAGMVVVVILVGFWLVGDLLSRGDPVPGWCGSLPSIPSIRSS